MSEEIRRPSDTYRMSREDIDAALAAQHRETLPPEIQCAVAEAQGMPLEMCAMCRGAGLVTPETNEAYALHVGADFEESPITAVDDVVTQPVKPRGR